MACERSNGHEGTATTFARQCGCGTPVVPAPGYLSDVPATRSRPLPLDSSPRAIPTTYLHNFAAAHCPAATSTFQYSSS